MSLPEVEIFFAFLFFIQFKIGVPGTQFVTKPFVKALQIPSVIGQSKNRCWIVSSLLSTQWASADQYFLSLPEVV